MRNAKLALLCGVAATLALGAMAPAMADGYERPRVARKAPAKPKPKPAPLAGEAVVYRDRIVEKIVEKRVEVPVDRIVEKRIEVPVEKIVEKRIEVPVDRIVEKRVEVPVDRVVYRDRIVDRPVDRIVEKRVEVPVDRVVYRDRIIDRPVDRIVEKRVEVPVDRVVYRDRVIDRPVDRIVEKRVEVPVERVVYRDRIVEKPVERVVYVERPLPPPVVMAPVRVSPSHDCGCDHEAGYAVGATSSTTYSSGRVIDERYESYGAASASGGSIAYGGVGSYGVGPSDYELQTAMSLSRTGLRGGWNGAAYSGGGYAVQSSGGTSISSQVMTSQSMGSRYVGGGSMGVAKPYGGRR